MKTFVIIFMVLTISAHITSAKKLRLINGLNGGLVAGVNGVNPVLVGGLNPAVLSGGAAVIGQPPLTQFLPAAALPPYVLPQPPAAALLPQPPAAALPYGPANAGAQLAYPFAPPNGQVLPYYIGAPQNQPAIIPPQQQVVPGQGPIGNNQAVLPGSLTRFKRSLLRRTTAKPPASVTNVPAQANPTVSGNLVG